MVYSFLNVSCIIAGPGGLATCGAGGAAAEEGITIEATVEKNVMTIGADGKGQHSLVADNSCKATIRLLKTSPINAILQIMYDLQSASSALWGQNVITVIDSGRFDLNIIQSAAFNKKATLTYAKEAGMNEWVFDGIQLSTVLGAGQ